MKTILIIIFVLISVVGFSQPMTTYTVSTIAEMKTYFGTAKRIHVTANNQDYTLCTDCSTNEVTIFAGAGSRKWKTAWIIQDANVRLSKRVVDTIFGGVIWQHSDRPYSPFQLNSQDTLAANDVDPPTEGMPLSGIFARRTMYINSGIYHTQKVYGHYFNLTWNWLDTMSFRTDGGDYDIGTIVESRLKPRGTGKQVTAIHGTGNNNNAYYGVPTFLANTVLENSASNHIYTRGWLVGISSYLVTGFNAADTVERFSHYQTQNFLGNSSFVKKMYAFDMQQNTSGALVDSSFGLWDQYGFRHYLRGNTIIGAGDSTVTDYKFKVTGATYHKGLVQNNQGADVASTAGVMTLGPDGNAFEITGTNTITAISNVNKKNDYVVILLFTSTATLVDGTANSGTSIGMELSGNANFTGSADDTITLVLCEIGGTQRWREVSRSVN